MLKIICPYCGPRTENEFTFGGESYLTRPKREDNISDSEWGNYLYFRINPRGVHAENWRHTFGCGQWFNALRHTVTHEVLATYAMNASRPEVTPS